MSLRLPDWQVRLARLMEERRAAPFAWGVHDCCLFAADAVLAVTGRDLAGDLRGRYHTRLGAARLLRRQVGAGGVVAMAAARLVAVVAPLHARPGDVGCVMTASAGPALAVFGGAAWHAPGAAGLQTFAHPEVQRAWRCDEVRPHA